MQVLIACQDPDVMGSVARLWNEKGYARRKKKNPGKQAKSGKPFVRHTKNDGDSLKVFPPSNGRCDSEKDSRGGNMGD